MQQLLAGYLINAAWQIPVVALCAILVSRFGGLSPQARNRLWLLFLGVAAVLPAVSLAALLPHPGPTVARLPADAAALAALEASAAAPDAVVAAAKPALELSDGSAWAMTALSAAVVAIIVLRLTIAARAARRLVRQSHPVALPLAIARDLERLAQAHGRHAAPVRSSREVSSPAVVGAVSPVILIPEGRALQDDDLRAALLHEMAHVVRHDYAVNLACELLTLPVCWHPALMALKAGVARSRELACDAMAADALGSPKTYARRLVSLAQTLGGQPVAASPRTLSSPPAAALAVGLFGRSDLEDRLMHLMKPKDIEAPALRAARLCGLAAVGAGLLGSAALLHVTPVFAQTQTTAAPVTAQPLAPPPAAAMAATQQAQKDAGQSGAAAPSAHRHRGMIINDDRRVIIGASDGAYRHTFKASDGRDFTVYTDDAKDPSPEQQREFEAQVQKAEAHAAEVMKRVNSPEFKARIAAAQAHAAEVEARVNSPEFKAKIAAAEARAADVEKMVNSPEFKARIAAAEKAGQEAAARVNSPEFQAKIAAAQARAAEAEKRVNSPEFKARIALAQSRAADVEKMVNSPEFKAKIARAAEAAARVDSPEFRERMERLERRFDDLDREDAPATPSSPTAPRPTP